MVLVNKDRIYLLKYVVMLLPLVVGIFIVV